MSILKYNQKRMKRYNCKVEQFCTNAKKWLSISYNTFNH